MANFTPNPKWDGRSNEDESNLTTMIIIIIVVVVILVCILLGLGIFLWVRKKRKEDRETNSPVFCEDQPSEVGMRLSLLGKHYKITSILNLERKSSTTSTFRDKSSLTNSIEFNIPEVESEQLMLNDFDEWELNDASDKKTQKNIFAATFDDVDGSAALTEVSEDDGDYNHPNMELSRTASTYLYGLGESRRSSHSSQDQTMMDIESRIGVTSTGGHEAPLASVETLSSTIRSRPFSTEMRTAYTFPQGLRPQSDGTLEASAEEIRPSLPPKKAASKKIQQYKSMGVLHSGPRGVARKIAQKNAQNDQVVSSQSDGDLSRRLRKRNPFADSDDEDDFVDIQDLPPLPVKKQEKPQLHPKQRINKSRDDIIRIDNELLSKLRSKKDHGLVVLQDRDYEDVVPTNPICSPEDYDEPIPHSSMIS